ncbi:hypothetical protein BCU70_09810 [Vibrio sp. 10N.286.49.C2]|uniref:hypothetical protein n=1 Tax=unclassified Vibrio TaxID=2614977 RepID=UPI000C84D8A4|nr:MULTISPECIES: hypothetical protein [unclassified Vibrio]PMH26436.1 hypothetical protein BCU70_09810 [Vibrio sp. 10N.286.49.C2]PMH54840.1 hypothetical protein BCU66_11125 [Vibrio sp. 10N.286.49.B1]PMH82096.1 hypothetical protein BCU58_19360 [Vibrio sp. 10N.286.48.B7]
MHYMSLQLDAQAQQFADELLDGLENQDGWIKMTARYAALIDTRLSESQYVGTVTWFSDEDYIEHHIEYT